MTRLMIPALVALVLFASFSINAKTKFTQVFFIRSMTLNYFDMDRRELVNDYRLFGIVKEAIENTWKAREGNFKIANGLTFNSPRTTSGKLEIGEYDIGIVIQTRRRSGKLLYIFNWECSSAGESAKYTEFDLIETSRFYAEIKRLSIEGAKSCPD